MLPESRPINWHRQEPLCTEDGQNWCAHVLTEIRFRRDVIEVPFSLISRDLIIPISSKPLPGERIIPKYKVRICNEPTGFRIETPIFGITEVLGYEHHENNVMIAKRRDLQGMVAPYLLSWILANPCQCQRRYDHLLGDPGLQHELVCRAAFRLNTPRGWEYCPACDPDDLIPDISPTYPAKK